MNLVHLMKKYTGLLLLVSMLAGYLLPGLAWFKPSLSWLLILMLYSSLLNININPRRFLRKELIYFPLLNWLILPLIAFIFTAFLPVEYRLGIFIAIITPPALGSPVMIYLAEGDVELGMSNLILFNLLAPFTLALLPYFYFQQVNIQVPVFPVLLNVTKIIITPFLLSILTKRWVGSYKEKLAKTLGNLSPLMIIFLVAVVVASAADQIRTSPVEEITVLFLVIFCITFVLYFCGYILGRRTKRLLSTLPFIVGHKNTGLAILVCISNFSAKVALPAVFYIISHHILNALILQRLQYSRKAVS